MTHREDALKRLGATLVACDECGATYAYNPDEGWMTIKSTEHGELDVENGIRIMCSGECADAFVAKNADWYAYRDDRGKRS